MNLVTLDFETYFADDYTLSKMTTESYVRDPRFKAHMLGFKVNNSKVSMLEDEEEKYLLDDTIKNGALVCHHAHFDGLILSHHYGIRPAFWFDTLSMARIVFPHAKSHSLGNLAKMLGLQEKTVPYESFKNIRDLSPDLYNRVAEGCANDVELTYAIFKKMLPLVPRDELRLIDLTVRMFTEPSLALDRHRLDTYLVDSTAKKSTMLDELGVTKEDLGSANKFAALLGSLGVEPPTKISKTTGKSTFAFAKTDHELKELLKHDNEKVSSLVAARLGVKSNMVETRAQRLLDMDERGAMCVYLKYYGAHPGRWSGGDKMNWQNFKRKSVIRESLEAPKGYVICVIDAAQIEARLLDFWAGQNDYVEKWRQGVDTYSETATKFYGRNIYKCEELEAERGMGKQIILSCGFGAGAESIQNTARIGTYGPPVYLTLEEAKTARDLYRTTHYKVVELWTYATKTVLPSLLTVGSDFTWGPVQVRDQRIYLPNGAWIDYTNLQHNGKEYYQLRRDGEQKTYGAKIVQNVVEGLSRTILAKSMLEVARKYRIVTCTHDEIVYLAPENEAQAALDFGLDIMKTAPVWCLDLPLNAEGGYARNYSK